MKIIIATQNKGKLNEFKQLLDFQGVTLLDLSDVAFYETIEETGSTFEENALIKARRVHEVTGLPVIADDSGLEVDALNGAPGVFSARYSDSGEDLDNNALLLKNLQGVKQRQAQFVCALAYIDTFQTKTFFGTLKGSIALEMSGHNGFGYDSLFISEVYNKTLATLTSEEKNAISHRAKAVMQLKEGFDAIINHQ